MPLVGNACTHFVESELEYIRSTYLFQADYEIADALNKSVNSIRLKRQRMGFTRYRLSMLTGKKELIRLPSLKEQEIEALEHFIASDPSSVLKEIAYNRLEDIFRSKQL